MNITFVNNAIIIDSKDIEIEKLNKNIQASREIMKN